MTTPDVRSFIIGLTAIATSLAMLPIRTALFAATLAILGMVVVTTDLDRLIIPDWANAAILAVGLALVATEAQADQRATQLGDAILRVVVAAGTLFLLRFLYRLLTNLEGLGLGDVKLAAAGAPWLSWNVIPLALELAALSAIAAIVIRAARHRSWPDRHFALPFGAFLAPAIWIMFLAERVAGLGAR